MRAVPLAPKSGGQSPEPASVLEAFPSRQLTQGQTSCKLQPFRKRAQTRPEGKGLQEVVMFGVLLGHPAPCICSLPGNAANDRSGRHRCESGAPTRSFMSDGDSARLVSSSREEEEDCSSTNGCTEGHVAGGQKVKENALRL
ncbi:hypothetical protein AAFF_G00436170 [Aldrovandia affinis]|uniref:Uncharacterized protein n=1 Tax=Aldrovandia affinis TaxID=143900 RepID=A0AAD7WI34_9TELE|nr:hypothetical protein AAFF_G00436170 [Aldrovandia affinis]